MFFLSVWSLFIFGSWWGMMRLAVIEVLLHSSRQLHLQIWSSSCTLQMGSRATPCRNHKRWGLEWSRKHGFLSNQYPLCPVHFLSSTVFHRDYWPTSFSVSTVLCCVFRLAFCQCRGCVPDGGHHCSLLWLTRLGPFLSKKCFRNLSPDGPMAAPVSAERLGLWFAGLCLLPDRTGCCGVNLGTLAVGWLRCVFRLVSRL